MKAIQALGPMEKVLKLSRVARCLVGLVGCFRLLMVVVGKGAENYGHTQPQPALAFQPGAALRHESRIFKVQSVRGGVADRVTIRRGPYREHHDWVKIGNHADAIGLPVRSLPEQGREKEQQKQQAKPGDQFGYQAVESASCR